MTFFFIWTYGQEKLEEFPENFNKFHPDFGFTHEYSRKNNTFLDLDAKILDCKIVTYLHIKNLHIKYLQVWTKHL